MGSAALHHISGYWNSLTHDYVHVCNNLTLYIYVEQEVHVLLSLMKGLKSVLIAAGDEKPPTLDTGPHLDSSHISQAITDAWESVCTDDGQCAILCGALVKEDGGGDYKRDESHKGMQVLEEFAECLWMVNFKPDLSKVRKKL